MSDIELMPRARPKTAIPIGRPMAMSEPNARSRMTTAATSPISSPMPVAASSNAKNRSPPISIRSGEPAPAPAPSALEVLQVVLVRSSSTGYWTRMRATRPSGEIAPLPRPPRVRRPPPRRVGGVEHLGQVGDRRLDLGQGGPRVRGVEEGRPLVARRQDHLRGESDLVRPGGREQVGGLLGVEARHLEGVLEVLTEGAGRADHQHRDDQP